MLMYILLMSFLTYGTQSTPFNKGRVVGGRRALKGEIPYIVSIKRSGRHSCGGSILDKNHILTAAHCVYGNSTSPLTVQYGVVDSLSPKNIINVTTYKYHEDFEFVGNYINDIAMLKLANDIIFGPNVKPTILPSSNLNFTEDSIKSRLSGWGVGNGVGVERYLLTAILPLYNDEVCETYLSHQPYPPNYDRDHQICAGDLDGTHKQCNGDSGGPLYAMGVQHGVVSWSIKPCNSKNMPGVFTRVAVYLDWINKTMHEL